MIGTCGVHPRRLSSRDTWLLLYETPNSSRMTPATRSQVQTSPRKPYASAPCQRKSGIRRTCSGVSLGPRPRPGASEEGLRPAAPGGGQPLADGPLGGAEGGGDVALLPALLRAVPAPSSAATPSSHEGQGMGFPYRIIGAGKV